MSEGARLDATMRACLGGRIRCPETGWHAQLMRRFFTSLRLVVIETSRALEVYFLIDGTAFRTWLAIQL